MNDEAGQNMMKDKLSKEDKTPVNTYIPQIYPSRLRWSCIVLEPRVGTQLDRHALGRAGNRDRNEKNGTPVLYAICNI